MAKQLSEVRGLFRPLISEYGDIYLGCARYLLEKSQGRGLSMSERDAKAYITDYLQSINAVLNDEELEEESIPEDTPQPKAARVVLYFRKCGWIKKRSLNTLDSDSADLSPECRDLVRAVDKILGNVGGIDINGNLIGLFDKICTTNEDRWRKPYVRIILGARQEIDGIRDQLQLIENGMEELIRLAADITAGADIEAFLLDNKFYKNTIESFYKEKRGGLTDKYIRRIKEGLLNMRREENLALLSEDLSSYREISLEEAETEIIEELDLLSDFIGVEYPDMIDDIERKYILFHKRFQTRMRVALGKGFNFESVLSDFTSAYAKMSQEDREKTSGELLMAVRLYKTQAIIPQDVKLKKKQTTSKEPIWQEVREFPKEKIAEDQLFFEKQKNNPYTSARVKEFITNKMENGEFKADSDTVKESDVPYIFEAFLQKGKLDIRFHINETESITVGNVTMPQMEIEMKEEKSK